MLEDSSIRAAVVLRPLTIGEMFDRAVTLSVAFFVALAAIYIVYLIPLTILEYFATPDLTKVFAAVTDAIAKGGTSPDAQAIAKALSVPSPFAGLSVVYFAAALLVYPLPTAALMWTVAKIYTEGRVPRFVEAYRRGFDCWVPLLLVGLMWIVCGTIAYLAFVLLAVIITFVSIALGFAVKGLAIVFGLLVGVPILLAFILSVLVAVLAATISSLEIVVERSGFITAFSTSLRRVFGRSFRRSVLMSLALAAIGIGISLMGLLVQGILLGVLHSNALSTAFGGVLRIVIVIFSTVAVTIYYYDILVRTEGFDLTAIAAPAENIAPVGS